MSRVRPSSRRLLPLLTVAFIAPLAFACGEGAVEPEAAPDRIEELPRQLSAAEGEVIDHSNAFAFELLREVHEREDESPNVFLSPLSASTALGMTLNGADGGTYDSIRAVLGLDGMSQEQINRSYHDLNEMLTGLDPRVELTIANSAWSRQGFPFEPAFFDRISTWFDAEARELDFDDPAAVDTINGWAAEETNGRIEKVISEIEWYHILFLLNAVYFDGEWTDRFDPSETRPAPFTLAGGDEVEVERMMGEVAIGRGSVDGVRIGELPYGGQAFVMTVVLPPPDGSLAELVAGLNAETWARWMDAIGEYEEAPVELPKLEMEYEKKLNGALAAMGMGRAFDRDSADFSRLTPEPAWIDYVKQNTFLKVDEEGTEAAAVTTVAIRTVSAPAPFVVDRPYLLAIRERLTGAILFLGAIGDPREG